MSKESFSFRLDPDLVAAVDGARGDVSRTRWLERALEERLGGFQKRERLDLGPVYKIPDAKPRTVVERPLCKKCQKGLVSNGQCSNCRQRP